VRFRFVNYLYGENLGFYQIVTKVTTVIPVPKKFRETAAGTDRERRASGGEKAVVANFEACIFIVVIFFFLVNNGGYLDARLAGVRQLLRVLPASCTVAYYHATNKVLKLLREGNMHYRHHKHEMIRLCVLVLVHTERCL
jgi:hypothetical protein